MFISWASLLTSRDGPRSPGLVIGNPEENEKNPRQDVKLALPDRIEREGRVPIKIIKYHTDFRNVITDMDIIPQL
ncbi:hypothetical protein Neosp_011124 [[Neocosmospora] mangrovei]